MSTEKPSFAQDLEALAHRHELVLRELVQRPGALRDAVTDALRVYLLSSRGTEYFSEGQRN